MNWQRTTCIYLTFSHLVTVSWLISCLNESCGLWLYVNVSVANTLCTEPERKVSVLATSNNIDPTTLSWFKDSRPTYTSSFEKGAVGGAEETWRRSPVLTPRHVCWAQNNFNRLHVCRRLVRQTKLLPLHLYGAVRGDACFLHELQLILVYCSCSLFQLLEKQERRIFLPQEPRHLLI